ncbi:MAG: hypothetical protein WCL51_05835 [Bacteroidota bacterium]
MENSEFKIAANRHQAKYRQRNISSEYNVQETKLTNKDALDGKNFYDGFSIFNAAKKRHPALCSIYSEMLNSEHIAYDLFVPLRHNLTFCKNVLNDFMGGCIKSVDKTSVIDSNENIKIEFIYPYDINILNNPTINVYIEYTHKDNTKGIIGIEVKYAQFGLHIVDSKKVDNNNKQDVVYYHIAKESNIYKTTSLSKLKGVVYRQIWKYQMLTESMMLKYNEEFKHASLILLYPKDNEHFKQTGAEYAETLLTNDNKFKTLTYEEFLISCNRHCPNTELENWIDYLQERYIVKN